MGRASVAFSHARIYRTWLRIYILPVMRYTTPSAVRAKEAGVHLGGGGGGGHSPPLIKSRPPLEIASLQSASHVHRASPPLFFINTHFAPPLDQFLNLGWVGGTRPPLIKSRPPLEIASLQSASHVHRASPPPLFHKYSFRPPLDQFLNEGLRRGYVGRLNARNMPPGGEATLFPPLSMSPPTCIPHLNQYWG